LILHRNNTAKKSRFTVAFTTDQIIALRNDPMEGEQYMDLMDDVLKTVVGATIIKENRCKRHDPSEWFTIIDEAFSSCALKITGNCGVMNGW
jgi:hypothetical protein